MPGSSAVGVVYQDQEPSNITEPVRLMDLPVRRAAVRELVAEVSRYDDVYLRHLCRRLRRLRPQLSRHRLDEPTQTLRLVE